MKQLDGRFYEEIVQNMQEGVMVIGMMYKDIFIAKGHAAFAIRMHFANKMYILIEKGGDCYGTNIKCICTSGT